MGKTRFGFTKLLCFSTLLLVSATAQAGLSTVFTVTATADTTELGYTAGEAAVFTVVTNPNLTDASYHTDATATIWGENSDQFFSSVSGAGFGGVFTRPSAGLSDSVMGIYILNAGPLDNIYINVDARYSNIGITTPSGAVILQFDVNLQSVRNFTFGGDYLAPADYFSAFGGAYSAGGYIRITDTDINTVDFIITSVTISTSPVPEPSSCAAFAGLVGLAFVGLRRRK